jgi:hypothetical protein
VDQYIDKFEDWMTLMKRDHQYLPESFFLLRFLCGLKDTIKHDTKCHKPASLRAAYWFARRQEQSYLANKKNLQPTAAKLSNSTPAPRPLLPWENKAPLPTRPRERGKCWYCPKNWTYGHKCNTVKSMLNAIELKDILIMKKKNQVL